MHKPIEVAIDSADGIVDCWLERTGDEAEVSYSATILYPHGVGAVPSKVYEHTLVLDAGTGQYHFAADAPVHPKVLLLEQKLSEAITTA